ncbi:MAG: hypothetical protein J6X84_02460 [Treponema sp.]|nr:hypothetical protein [Treponema sp.]
MTNTNTVVLERKVPVQLVDQISDYIDYLCFKFEQNSFPKSINLSAMTEQQFNAEIQKGYDEMLAGKGRPAKEVFADILGR